jgi:hypothetical protein
MLAGAVPYAIPAIRDAEALLPDHQAVAEEAAPATEGAGAGAPEPAAT